MILGISLVVNELNKGQRMVFRYPESIPAVVENGPNKGLVKLYNQYFSFSLENLAKLFRPKNALYSKVLEISVDDLCFVSYPCQCQGLTYNDTGTDNDSTSNCLTGLSSSPTLSPAMSPVNSIITNNFPGEVITMFNVIITSVSSKAMRQIIPDFEFKCQFKFASMPGSDPVAAALGLRCQTYGICKQTMRRLVEEVASALLQQEKSSRYVTEQVTLMLRIMDNYSATKLNDCNGGSGNGSSVSVPVMESGSQAAQAVIHRVSETDSTPGVSRTNSTRPGYSDASSNGTTAGTGATPGTTTGSYGNTPRTSRSNSNAPPIVFDTSTGIISPPVAFNSTTTAVANKTGPSSSSSMVAPVHSATATSTAGTGGGIATDSMQGVIVGVTPKSSRASAALHELTRMGEEGVRGPGSPMASTTAAGSGKGLSIETDFTSGILEGHSASQITTPSVLAAGAITTAPSQHLPTGSHSYLAQALLSGSSGEITGLNSTESGKNSPSLPYQSHESATTTVLHSAGTVASALNTTLTSSASLNPSRTNSSMAPVIPSRTGSGLSTTPNKPPACLSTVGSVGDTSSSLVGTTGVIQDTHSTEWGAHLLIDFIAQSSLANELRLLYHAMSGGHSVNISFNSVKSTNLPMFCKDAALCEDSQLLRTMQYCSINELIPGGGLLVPPPTTPVGGSSSTSNKYTTVNLSNIKGSSTSNTVRTRHTSSPYARNSNLNAVLHGSVTSHPNTPHKTGKNSRGYAKMKGINLNSQTMLRIADSDTIINILHTLDTNVFCLVTANSESSGLNSHANTATNSATDLVGMKNQIRMLTSSRLFAFLDAADPTQSFLDLSMTLDEPVEELVSMANYLRSWGLAEVIPVIYSRSCYKVHSQAALHRDCRVGRAYEALLMSFNLPLQPQQPISRVETELTMSRPNSEPFLLLGALGGIPHSSGNGGSTTPTPLGEEYTSGTTKRRSSSMVSTDGSCDSTRPLQYMNTSSQSSATTFHSVLGPHPPVPPISTAHSTAASAGGQGHYLVSPEVSKFRRRREGARDEASPATSSGGSSLHNSRSGDLLKSFTSVQTNNTNTTSTVGGVERRGGSCSIQQGTAANQTSHPVQRTISANGSTAASTSAGVASGASGIGRLRERGNSFGNERSYQSATTGGIKAYISAIFGQVTSTSNELPVRPPPSRPTSILSDISCFREVDVPSPAPMSINRSGPTYPTSGTTRLGESSMMTESNPLSSSFPPASLSSMNMSTANRDQGMQHIVSLAEVGSVISPRVRTQSNLDDTVFSMLEGKTQKQQQQTADPNTPLSDLPAQPILNLDTADNIPVQYSLPVVLAAFNGARVLQEVVELLPAPLRDFSVDIVVFLLRWHVIVPVDSYIVNMLAVLEPHSCGSGSCTTCAQQQPQLFSATGATIHSTSSKSTSSSSSGVQYNTGTTATTTTATGRTPHYTLSGRSMGNETSAFSTSPGNTFSHSFYRNNTTGTTNTDSKPNTSLWEEAINPLRMHLPKGLNTHEEILIEKLYPYIVNLTISNKTVSEIAWVLRVSEEELLSIIDKIPYLYIVKKLAA